MTNPLINARSKAGQLHMCVFSYSRIGLSSFCPRDLDFDPMTLIYELDLDVLKMYHVPKMKFLCQGFQKLDRQTDRHANRRD